MYWISKLLLRSISNTSARLDLSHFSITMIRAVKCPLVTHRHMFSDSLIIVAVHSGCSAIAVRIIGFIASMVTDSAAGGADITLDIDVQDGINSLSATISSVGD